MLANLCFYVYVHRHFLLFSAFLLQKNAVILNFSYFTVLLNFSNGLNQGMPIRETFIECNYRTKNVSVMCCLSFVVCRLSFVCRQVNFEDELCGSHRSGSTFLQNFKASYKKALSPFIIPPVQFLNVNFFFDIFCVGFFLKNVPCCSYKELSFEKSYSLVSIHIKYV